MIRVFKRELKANAKSLLFWSLGMLALCAIGFYEYGGIVSAKGSLNAIFAFMPRMVRVMFGMGALPLETPEGYYACMFLWLSLIAFLHAALLGASLISREERDKTADFLFTLPLSRASAVSGKALAGVVNVLCVAVVAWGTSLATMLPQVEDKGLARDIHLTMLGMLVTQLVFLFAGLLFASLSRDHGRSGQLAACSVIITYFVSVLIEMSGEVDYLNFLSPFRYFHAAGVMESGLIPLYLFISAALISTTGFFSYRVYGKRDLRH